MKTFARFAALLLVLCVFSACLASCSSDKTKITAETTGNEAERNAYFSCFVNKFDNLNYSVALAEYVTEDPDDPGKIVPRETVARLNAKMSEPLHDFDGNDLPAYIDKIDGEHNGENYIAYTFYLFNDGEKALTYEYNLYTLNTTNGVDKGVRVQLYKDGECTTYARTKTDGTGPEPGTVEFMGETTIVKKQVSSFGSGEYAKFTIVIWIERNDADTTDDVIGGQFKIDMKINVVGDEEGNPIDFGN